MMHVLGETGAVITSSQQEAFVQCAECMMTLGFQIFRSAGVTVKGERERTRVSESLRTQVVVLASKQPRSIEYERS